MKVKRVKTGVPAKVAVPKPKKHAGSASALTAPVTRGPTLEAVRGILGGEAYARMRAGGCTFRFYQKPRPFGSLSAVYYHGLSLEGRRTGARTLAGSLVRLRDGTDMSRCVLKIFNESIAPELEATAFDAVPAGAGPVPDVGVDCDGDGDGDALHEFHDHLDDGAFCAGADSEAEAAVASPHSSDCDCV